MTGFALNKTNNVTMDNIINNFQMNFFTFTDAVNKIAQVLFTEYANFGKADLGKVDDAESNYSDLGTSIGRVTRSVIKFNKNKSDGGKKPRPTPSRV